jgi:hypothetical protein
MGMVLLHHQIKDKFPYIVLWTRLISIVITVKRIRDLECAYRFRTLSKLVGQVNRSTELQLQLIPYIQME